MVQGPLMDGIASINSRLNNLNLDSHSILVTDIPSSSHSIPTSSSSAMDKKLDELSALVLQLVSQQTEMQKDIDQMKLQQAQVIAAAKESVESMVIAIYGIKNSNEEFRQIFQQHWDDDLGEQIRKFMLWFAKG